MKLHMQMEMLEDLVKRLKRRVSSNWLMTFLSRVGTVYSTTLECGVLVMKFVDYAGKTVRAYGRNWYQALVALSHSYWCAGGDC